MNCSCNFRHFFTRLKSATDHEIKSTRKIIHFLLPLYGLKWPASFDVYIFMIKRNGNIFLLLNEHSKHAAHTGLWDLMWAWIKHILHVQPYTTSYYMVQCGDLYPLYIPYYICSYIRAKNLGKEFCLEMMFEWSLANLFGCQGSFNPFTPESDQRQNSLAASQEYDITQYGELGFS